MTMDKSTPTTRSGRGFNQKSRDRIKTKMITNRLQDFVSGKIELSNAQVMAAKILLDRVLPPMRPIEAIRPGDQGFHIPQLVVIRNGNRDPEPPLSDDEA